jgi:hypothetical protein
MSQPGLKMPELDTEERGEVTIAARSERPADLSHVMRAVVIPELVNVLIPALSNQERE